MDIFKSYISAMDRQIERKRELVAQDMAKHRQLVEKYIIENAEVRAKGQLRPIPNSLEWDYEPSGYQDVSNGELGS